MSDSSPADADDGPRSRDVEVPLRVYKAVTVFSTLFAVVGIVGGFVLLDEATDRGRAPPEEVDVALVVAGLAVIGLAAAVYAFSARFRARGMGKSKDAAAEGSDNG
jgi:hypothetical protein